MLVDRRVLDKILDAASICREETVLEAGTGQGILTAELCKVAKRVVSYEVDKNLLQQTQAHLKCENLEIVNADLFKTKNLRFDVFASNLPYSRSRDAIEWLASQKFGRAVVMVQEEFADKLVAKPGDKNYRAISALAAHCFAIEKLFSVGREAFEPRPKVISAVIRIIPFNTVAKETIKNLKLLFSKRNKKASTVTREAGIKTNFGRKRISQLGPSDLVKIAELMQSVQSI
jgi:16S rRNA (adenine1518-N6/adenine1519-N6)-dimethyltransferase